MDEAEGELKEEEEGRSEEAEMLPARFLLAFCALSSSLVGTRFAPMATVWHYSSRRHSDWPCSFFLNGVSRRLFGLSRLFSPQSLPMPPSVACTQDPRPRLLWSPVLSRRSSPNQPLKITDGWRLALASTSRPGGAPTRAAPRR